VSPHTSPDRRSFRRLLVVACSATAFAAFGALVACSSSTSSAPAPAADSGGSTAEDDGSVDASSPTDGAAADGAPAPENECTVFTDRTADTASRTLEWDLTIVSAPERCMRIKAGQTVTFGNGADAGANFSEHPLVIYKPKGGAAPMADPTTGQATFPTAALFGFACGVHPQMRGVILVE
jgi:plastocyanin